MDLVTVLISFCVITAAALLLKYFFSNGNKKVFIYTCLHNSIKSLV